MARFVAPHDHLQFEELGQDRFRLLAPLWFESDLLGGRTVKVPAGTVTDRETVPRWLPLIYAIFSGTASRSGVIHDRLYQCHKVEDLEVSRKLADAVYYEANGLDQNPGWKRWLKWLGLRIGGGTAYRTGPDRFQARGNERRHGSRRSPMTPEERKAVLDTLKRRRPPTAPNQTEAP